MKRSFTALMAALLLLGACSNTLPVAPAASDPDGCFADTRGVDRAYLNFKEGEGKIRGTLEYAFTQKDSSWGHFTGTDSGTSLSLEYQYLSEGVLSTRQLTLTREDQDTIKGEGWTFQRSTSCGIGDGWTNASVTSATADTFHDPETGYYARAHFTIAGPLNGYTYRCIATITGVSAKVILDLVGSGVTNASTATKRQNLQGNIRPEQVKDVSAAEVICQTKTA